MQKDLNASPLFRLIEQGILNIEEVGRARAYQWERMMTFCQAVDALGILALDDCAAALESIGKQRIPLGEVLVRQGKITRETLVDALERHHRHQGRRGNGFGAST